MSSVNQDRAVDVERRSVAEWVMDAICDITGLSSADIGEASHIEELGLESLAIVSFSGRLERSIPDLRRSFIFDCRTIGEIVDYLVSRHPSEIAMLVSHGETNERRAPESDDQGKVHAIRASSPIPIDASDRDDDWPDIELPSPAARPPVERVAARPRGASAPREEGGGSTDGAVAVVGMHGRFPGAPDLGAFWTNLLAGVDLVSEIPADRWPLEGFYEEGTDSRKSGNARRKQRWMEPIAAARREERQGGYRSGPIHEYSAPFLRGRFVEVHQSNELFILRAQAAMRFEPTMRRISTKAIVQNRNSKTSLPSRRDHRHESF